MHKEKVKGAWTGLGDGPGHPGDVFVKAGGCAQAAAPLLAQVFNVVVLEVEKLLLDVIVLLEQKVKGVQQDLVDHRLEVLPAILKEKDHTLFIIQRFKVQTINASMACIFSTSFD